MLRLVLKPLKRLWFKRSRILVRLAAVIHRYRAAMASLEKAQLTNFIVLVNQILSYQGDAPLSAELMRLVSISVAIVIATLLLNLLSVEPKVIQSPKS